MPFQIALPLKAERFKDDTTVVTDADGHHFIVLGTHTQLPLDDEKALEKEAQEFHSLGKFIAVSMTYHHAMVAALELMAAEFRRADLPYGSPAYELANRLLNEVKQLG